MCLGSYASSMLLGCKVKVQDKQEDRGGNTEGLVSWYATGRDCCVYKQRKGARFAF